MINSLEEEDGEMASVSLQGQMLGKYRVLEPLGRGGMARVYRAYHPQLDRYVAIKVLRSDLVEDEEFLARFQREAQSVAALRHANIVQVFDCDVQDNIYYIVMELLEGDTLKTRLNDYRARDEQMALGDVVRILLDVLDGLAYAHSEGMIHRDIKPANVLLTKRGEAVVADFGIARIVGSTRHTASGALMGTLNYIAPEQGLQGQSDACSDIYSLGIVLYEMLTQRTPFDADTPLAILMKHLHDPLPLPRQIVPDIPEPFERVVLKALSKQPEDRYQSAEEMAQALCEAAEAAEVELPSRISLPLSFTTLEAPSEPVAVLSGTAREKITDADFAADDTDESLGMRLTGEDVEGGKPLSQAGRELLSAMGAMAHMAISKAARAMRKAAEHEAEKREPSGEAEAEDDFADVGSGEMPDAQSAAADAGVEPGEPSMLEGADDGQARRKRGGGGRAVLGALGLIALGNLCLFTIVVPTNYWDIFEQGWPMEIFLVSWALCIVMFVTSSIWMLIPVGSTLGTGIILAYCALTKNWDDWGFLWVFELWVVLGSIVIPIWLSRPKKLSQPLSRFLAVLLSLVSVACIIAVGLSVGLGGMISEWRVMIRP
jgi:serine/threonine protein kinase